MCRQQGGVDRRRPVTRSGRGLGLRCASSLGRRRQQSIQLPGSNGGNDRLNDVDELVFGRDGDAGLAFLKLERLKPVLHREYGGARYICSPPWTHASRYIDQFL